MQRRSPPHSLHRRSNRLCAHAGRCQEHPLHFENAKDAPRHAPRCAGKCAALAGVFRGTGDFALHRPRPRGTIRATAMAMASLMWSEARAPLGNPQYAKSSLTMSATSYHASSSLIPRLLHFASSFFTRFWRLRFLPAVRLR